MADMFRFSASLRPGVEGRGGGSVRLRPENPFPCRVTPCIGWGKFCSVAGLPFRSSDRQPPVWPECGVPNQYTPPNDHPALNSPHVEGGGRRSLTGWYLVNTSFDKCHRYTPPNQRRGISNHPALRAPLQRRGIPRHCLAGILSGLIRV